MYDKDVILGTSLDTCSTLYSENSSSIIAPAEKADPVSTLIPHDQAQTHSQI